MRLLYASVALLGAVLVLVGFLVDETKPGGVALVSVGSALLAVTLVQVSARFGGGEPIELALGSLDASIGRIEAAVAEIQEQARRPQAPKEQTNQVLEERADLKSTGLERIYGKRGEVSPLSRWLGKGDAAQRIDLLGLTMYDEWLRYEDLVKLLQDVARREDGRVRILLLARDTSGDDASPELAGPDLSYWVRLRQPGERERDLLPGYLENAHLTLEPLRKRFDPPNLEVREMRRSIPSSLVVRINDYMFVAPYLASVVGEESVAMEVRQPGSIFATYLREFETVWADEDPSHRPPDDFTGR